MGKSIRSKREKRLRAIRRDIVEPLYQKKEDAKLAAQEAAFNAPKLPVREIKTNTSAAMEIVAAASSANTTDMDVEMTDRNRALKPIGKKLKKKIALSKKHHGKGKGKIRRKHNV